MDNHMARARIEVGYSQDDVAAALGVSRAMVSYWESGKRSPSDRQVAALARLYRVSVAQLEGKEPLPTRADEARMLFRGAENELSGQAKQGLAEFSEFLDNYAHLASIAKVDIRGLTQSPFVSGSGYETADDARRKAEEVRAHLRLGLGAISDIDAVAELLGITVFRAALGTDLRQALSGAFFHHPEVGYSILVNLEMTPGRRRFTLAHELAHALFHSRDRIVLSRPNGGPKERFADTFAGEFLMPTEGIRRVMEDQGVGPRVTDPAEVVHLQRYFNVSFGMTLVRLQRAKLISQQNFDNFQRIRPVVLAQSLGYEIGDEEFAQNPELWRLRRFPRRFLALVRDAVLSDVISPSSAADLTRLSIDDIEELIGDRQMDDPDPGVSDEINDYRQSGVLADA
jgi:Zn-dependent peptidase ImmA (M78 family)/DNA-binding XRE family transcriptional regulator